MKRCHEVSLLQQVVDIKRCLQIRGIVRSLRVGIYVGISKQSARWISTAVHAAQSSTSNGVWVC